MLVDEHTITLDQLPVFYRSAGAGETPRAGETPGAGEAPRSGEAPEAGEIPGAGEAPGAGEIPLLYLHGAPTSSDDWLEPLARTGGVAPDLPGFGRSVKAGHLEYTPGSLAAFVGRFLDRLGVERVTLVAHDWGAAAGLMFAAGAPQRVRRLILFNPVPMLAGHRWHRPARIWRTPAIGELAMGATTKWMFRRALRHGCACAGAWPAARVDAAWGQFDQGTQRAVLRLHRWADEQHLAAAEALLQGIRIPTLLLWGERDPWFGPEVADAYGQRLRYATVEHLAGAGHWPWLDAPSLIERVAEFARR